MLIAALVAMLSILQAAGDANDKASLNRVSSMTWFTWLCLFLVFCTNDALFLVMQL